MPLTKTVFDALRGTQPLFHALFGVKTLSGTLLGPAFKVNRVTRLGAGNARAGGARVPARRRDWPRGARRRAQVTESARAHSYILS